MQPEPNWNATYDTAKFSAKFAHFAKFYGSAKLQVHSYRKNLHTSTAEKMQSEKLAVL